MLFSHSVKRIVAILLLGMLLFNWGGYRLVSGYLETKADSRLEASIDREQYNEADLVSIKVAANLPYYTTYTHSANFERVDGEVVIKGVSYKYVKRRLYNDSLELLCIRNTEKAGLQNAKDQFFRLANDLANDNSSTSKKAGHTNITKFSVPDFTDDHGFVWQYKTGSSVTTWNQEIFAAVKSAFLDRLDKPPQA
jgi:hypothetical protein